MSLDKAIEYGKEKRKKYYKAKAVDYQCRNHGNCEYCKGNRLYRGRKEEEKVKYLLKEYKDTLK